LLFVPVLWKAGKERNFLTLVVKQRYKSSLNNV